IGSVVGELPQRPETGADTRAVTPGRIAEPLASSPEAAPASQLVALREDTPGAWSPDDPLGIVIFGRILDESGHDVDGSVWFEHDEYGGRSGLGDFRGRPTDLPGFIVRGLRPGTWRVTARAEPFLPFEGQIELGPTPTRLRYDVVLKRSTLTFVKFRTP